MFEEEILLGDTEDSIRLETRQKSPIKNVIAPEPGVLGQRKYALIRKQHGQDWRNRKPACGVYNCYGMVFASRRTAILDDDQIPMVLREDGYRPVVDEMWVRPGDLVFYRLRAPDMLLHVAVILRRDDTLGTLFALSKWNSISGEDEHNIRHHCWSKMEPVELDFWTDRPGDARETA